MTEKMRWQIDDAIGMLLCMGVGFLAFFFTLAVGFAIKFGGHNTMLPFNPQPLTALQARYATALDPIYDAEAVERGHGERPGTLPKHVFDCDTDGLRLIISRDRMPDGKIYLHISASFRPRSVLYGKLAEGIVSSELFGLVEAHWQAIAQSSASLKFAGFSPGKGVAHFYIPED